MGSKVIGKSPLSKNQRGVSLSELSLPSYPSEDTIHAASYNWKT